MTDTNKYEAYKKARTTVDEINQVIMLYEGAVNFVKQAKEAINENNHEKRYNLINKAIAIVTGLNSCLEFNEQTNDVASALDEYYQSMDMRLLYIQCDNSLKSCDRVIEDLQTMLNAWVDIEKETKTENSSGNDVTLPQSPEQPTDETADSNTSDNDEILESLKNIEINV